ncbi:cation:proton antiporter [Halonotius terrestris]|uniref:Cation:proton antiporter n=1 Tax=Halonotius terrestris TaxID=2487750 RepID=A0A8J8PB55_9EURY|nr:MnhB domain-containing protein [Halonotius terrestris]TQQ80838.1 cation:proton antiporter [Halonotius terrestris]
MSSDRSADGDAEGTITRQRPIYTESQVIMTTVKVVIPFVLTYGLFITFHGTSSPGGGFQGGALIASVVLMIAFAFGIESTRAWLSNTLVVGLGTVGVAIFAAIALIPMALGGDFLEYTAYYPVLGDTLGLKEYEFVKYGMEAVEIGGIAFIVSGVLMGLFFALAAGFTPADLDVTGAASDAPTDEAVGDDASNAATDATGEVDAE